MKRFKMVLKKSDFQSAETLEKLKVVIVNLQSLMRNSWKLDDDLIKSIQEKSETSEEHLKRFGEYLTFSHQCELFFIEIISSLSFEQSSLKPKEPSVEVVDYLINIVFPGSESTRSLTPFADDLINKNTTLIRSYLFQLLVGLRSDYAWKKLEEIFDKFQRIIKDDSELLVLCIQCFEDECYKQFDGDHKNLSWFVKTVLEKLEQSEKDYKTTYPVMSLQHLRAIANLRFCYNHLTKKLGQFVGEELLKVPQEFMRVLQRLETFFSEPKNKYPAEYFVKRLVRRHGIEVFKTLQQLTDTSFDWIVPKHLVNKDEEDGKIAGAIKLYFERKTCIDFCEALTVSMACLEFTELDKAMKCLITPEDSVIVNMAILATRIKYQTLPDQVANHLKQLIASSVSLNEQHKQVASGIVCGSLKEMQIVANSSSVHQYMTEIIVHSVSVILLKSDHKLLKPLFQLVTQPTILRNVYLPTMPDSYDSKMLAEVLNGVYYVCEVNPNHRFLSEACEQPEPCPQCKGQVKKADNSVFISKQSKGHILGSAAERSNEPEGLRDLSPSHCAMIRVLIHAILTWSSAHSDKDDLTTLASGVAPNVPAGSLSRFFWKNLKKDIDILSNSLKCSVDDSVMLFHLVLKQLVEVQDPILDCDSSWDSEQSRREWENDFSEHYSSPIVKDFDSKLKEAHKLIFKDTGSLFAAIYENEALQSHDDNHFKLWRYRSRISLEHLSHALHNEDCKILLKFLQQEPILRAMQYLPEIIKLQKILFDFFHQQTTQEEAMQIKIGEYKKQHGKEFSHMVQSFAKAWNLVKKHLPNHGRLPVPQEYTNVHISDDDTKIAYLVPTTFGEGICSSSLVDFLVLQHNDFLQYCYGCLSPNEYNSQKAMENAIPLNQLQLCHVLNYESRLIAVILTHCQYSLEYGKGTKVEYNFKAIEKDLVDKFIYGKPLIMVVTDKIPRVSFRKDMFDATRFESIESNVTQIPLPIEKKKAISDKVKGEKLPNINEWLGIIEIVLSFLASAGGEPKITFGHYIIKTLTIQKKYLPKYIKDIPLENATALWQIITMQQSRKLTLLEKEPFDKLDEHYCVSLDQLFEHDKSEKEKLDKAFKQFPSPDEFLSALHEFIMFASHSTALRPNWRLTEVWIEAMDGSHVHQKVELSFSDAILMCHVFDVWKKAVFHYEKLDNYYK